MPPPRTTHAARSAASATAVVATPAVVTAAAASVPALEPGPLSPPSPGPPPNPSRVGATFVSATTLAHALPCFTTLVPGAGVSIDPSRVFGRAGVGCDQGTSDALASRLAEVTTRIPPIGGVETHPAIWEAARKLTVSRASDKSATYRKMEARKLTTEYIGIGAARGTPRAFGAASCWRALRMWSAWLRCRPRPRC